MIIKLGIFLRKILLIFYCLVAILFTVALIKLILPKEDNPSTDQSNQISSMQEDITGAEVNGPNHSIVQLTVKTWDDIQRGKGEWVEVFKIDEDTNYEWKILMNHDYTEIKIEKWIPEFNSDPFNPSTTEIEFVNPIGTKETDAQFVNPIGTEETNAQFVPTSENPLYQITCYSSSDGFPATNLVCRGGTVQEWVDYALNIGLDGICAAGGRTEWYQEAKHAHPPIILEITDHGRYLLVDRAPKTSSVIDIWVPWKAGVDGPMWNHYKEVKVYSGDLD